MRHSDLDPEMIGTFRHGDGNGRLGRILVSRTAGRTALQTLADHGIVTPIAARSSGVGRNRT